MKPLQQIECSPDQLSTLFKIYEESDLHDLRQRSHAIILRHNNYRLEEISFILARRDNDIMIIIKAFFYFGFEGLNNLDYEDLFKKIQKIEESDLPLEKKNFWALLNALFEASFKYLLITFLIFSLFKFWQTIEISNNSYYPIFFILAPSLLLSWLIYRWWGKSLPQSNVSHSASNKNNLNLFGNNNSINQINGTFYIGYANGEIRKANETSEVVKALDKFSNSNEEFKSNDVQIDNLYKLAVKYNSYKPLKHLILLAVGAYIFCTTVYGATLKGGILVFSFLLIQFTATVLSDNETVAVQKSGRAESVLISSDTVISKENPPYQEDEIDFAKIRASEEHEFLIDVSDTNAISFLTIEPIYIDLQSFFVAERDGRAYLQVASYKKASHALIQRENLIENHGFKDDDCRILHSNIFGKSYYGVTIGDAARDDIKHLSEIQAEWNLKAHTSNVRAFLKTN